MFRSPEAQFAVEAVGEAARLARRVQQEMVAAALTKDDRSPVTVADFAVQAVIAQRLAESLPGSNLIGEEQADALRLEEGLSALDDVTQFVRSSIPDATPEEVCGLIDRGRGKAQGTFWTLDPIDGTKGFLRGDQYAVALAWICDGRVEIGVLGCPELEGAFRPAAGGLGSLIAAVRGEGAWTRPLERDGQWQQLAVSNRSQPVEARLLRSVERSHTNADAVGQLLTALGSAAPPVAMDSQAKYAVLAAGGADLLVRLISPLRPDYAEMIWDQAAGSIVVTEAGGRVTDLDGRPLDFSRGRTLTRNRGILASNGHLHEAVLAALREIGA